MNASGSGGAQPSGLPPWLLPAGEGVYAIDTGFHRDHFDAAWLVVNKGRGAFIDTGTHFALPRLLGALESLDLTPDVVDWVIPTHVHLDHAGGVGSLMQHLPQARLLVHPRGERHMVDPSALWAGATAVYGEAEMARSYGVVHPVPAARVQVSHDGQRLDWAGRGLELIDTPGHARHHHCIWDPQTRGWFTGDTFGLSYREFDSPRGAWILPTSTPVQFEPEALQASIARLLARDPACIYLTHYGRVDDVPRLGALLQGLLAEMTALGESQRGQPDAQARHAALKRGQLDIFSRSLRDHGVAMGEAQIAELLAIDLELNAQGMAVWLDRPARG
jgi:glyoxylase-like metal-dependent hydrolase (beta-lactamase superfamily II)